METGEIKRILNLIESGPKKSLGQHFLTSPTLARKIVDAAQIKREDTVLEIGPGLGILTSHLVASPTSKLFLCEKDRNFCEYLKGEYKNNKVKIICEDALILIPTLQVESPFKVVSNLPYNISSPVIISLLTACQTLPETMVLMLQKEVADRLIAPPHDSNRGILTVLLELFGEVKIVERVSKNQFYPAPQVDSAVISFSNIKALGFEPKIALRILKLSFAGKRKKIKNSLFSSLKIPTNQAQEIAEKSGFSLEQRPEELTKEQWVKLISNINSAPTD